MSSELNVRHSAAQAANVACFVQIGAAASVFDHQPLSQIDESHPLKQPEFSPYIATKSIAEQRVIVANRPGFRTSVVRPSWIWGNGDRVLPQLVTALKTGQFIWIAQGNYPYMTTHVTNVCRGAILAAERRLSFCSSHCRSTVPLAGFVSGL